MRDNQVPSFRRVVRLAVIRNKERRTIPTLVTVNQSQNIILDVPFGMTAALVLNITAKRPMPLCPKRLAHFLAFLASHKYIQIATLLFQALMAALFVAHRIVALHFRHLIVYAIFLGGGAK